MEDCENTVLFLTHMAENTYKIIYYIIFIGKENFEVFVKKIRCVWIEILVKSIDKKNISMNLGCPRQI